MTLPSISPQMLHAGNERFLSRVVPQLGISLSEMDYLRGWKDDFLGDFIADQYNQQTSEATSTIALVDNDHGGICRLTAGAAAGRYARLWLGAVAGGYNSLDADSGWVMISRMSLSATTNVAMWLGAAICPAINRQILIGVDTNISGNWVIFTQSGAGSGNTDSGIAADGSWHIHVAEVTTGEVNYYLDGRLLATRTLTVPTEVLTPLPGMVYSRGAAQRRMNLDYSIAIPRNL